MSQINRNARRLLMGLGMIGTAMAASPARAQLFGSDSPGPDSTQVSSLQQNTFNTSMQIADKLSDSANAGGMTASQAGRVLADMSAYAVQSGLLKPGETFAAPTSAYGIQTMKEASTDAAGLAPASSPAVDAARKRAKIDASVGSAIAFGSPAVPSGETQLQAAVQNDAAMTALAVSIRRDMKP